MNDRQAFALAHPLNQADGIPDLDPLRTVTSIARDTLLVVILAVDR